jgi:hypothetical protein
MNSSNSVFCSSDSTIFSCSFFPFRILPGSIGSGELTLILSGAAFGCEGSVIAPLGDILSQLSKIEDRRWDESVDCREGESGSDEFEAAEKGRGLGMTGLDGTEGDCRELCLAVPSWFSSDPSSLATVFNSSIDVASLKVSSVSESWEGKDFDLGRRYHSSGTTNRILRPGANLRNTAVTLAEGSNRSTTAIFQLNIS